MTGPVALIVYLLTLPLYEYGSKTPNNEVIKDILPIYVRQVEHCISSRIPGISGFADPHLGKFTAFQAKCSFPSCSPEKPSEIKSKFLFNSPRKSNNLLISANRFTQYDQNLQNIISLAKEYTKSNPVVMFVHGWMESYHYTREINTTIYGLNKLGYDVIFLEWSGGNKDLYVSTANSLVLAAQMGYLIKTLGISHKTYCAGFSIGANVCGLASQWLKQNGEIQLPLCTGIDPSAPFVQDCPSNLRLSADDCDVVTVIHSSYLGSPTGFGTSIKEGNCDYWIDFRDNHPGCPNFDLFDLENTFKGGYINSNSFLNFASTVIGCNHIKGLKAFALQVTSYPNSLLNFKECTNPRESLDCRNVNYMKGSDSALYSYPMPPFDSCKSTDNKTYCLCLE